eukprot:COSAG05_NODE_185_length_14731_cov_30.866389_2_plen_1011_part_00
MESVDSLGPRYFFGYLHHFHNAIKGCGRRGVCNTSLPGLKHFSISGTKTERSFLTHKARVKGMVLTSIWNDYEEACVLEPCVNTYPQPDVHSATAGGGNVGHGAAFLEHVIRGKLPPRHTRAMNIVQWPGWLRSLDVTPTVPRIPNNIPKNSGVVKTDDGKSIMVAGNAIKKGTEIQHGLKMDDLEKNDHDGGHGDDTSEATVNMRGLLPLTGVNLSMWNEMKEMREKRAKLADPSWHSVSTLYPLLAHSREALGIVDHPDAAVLDQALPSDPICTVVYPTSPPHCSPTTGMCSTATGCRSGLGCRPHLGSAFFTLELQTSDGYVSFGLNCSHSSTRSLVDFAPIVVASGPAAAVQGGRPLYHDPARLNSCAEMASSCPPDAPFLYGDKTAGYFCCESDAGPKTGACAGSCCLEPGSVAGCQNMTFCPAHNWTEYGNDCTGWYCSAQTPETTSYCERPDICSGCPNTQRCRANCTGAGKYSHASCDCVDTGGGVCRLLAPDGKTPFKVDVTVSSHSTPVCVSHVNKSRVLTDAIARQLALRQTVFATSAGFLPTAPLVVYLQLELSLLPGAPKGMRVSVKLEGSSGQALQWPSQSLHPGATAQAWTASVDVASGTTARHKISASAFAGNMSAATNYWTEKLAMATGPRITAEQRVETAWKAWLANSFIHVRRGRGQGVNGSDLLYPQDGVLFYEAIFGYSGCLYASMLLRYGYTDHARRYIDSMIQMISPDGLFTLNFGLPDHGTLLLAMSDYFLITRNATWLSSRLDTVFQMYEWVIQERTKSMANQTKGSKAYGLIFYRPYCDHKAPTYSYLSDTYLVLGLEAIARALQVFAYQTNAPETLGQAEMFWEHVKLYRADVEVSMRKSLVQTPSGLRTVPIFPLSADLLHEGNMTARNYYGTIGSNLLEADFFDRESAEGNMIASFIERADGLVPGTAAVRFDRHCTQCPSTSDGQMRAAPPVDPPLPGLTLGIDHAYTCGRRLTLRKKQYIVRDDPGFYSTLNVFPCYCY